MPLPAHVAEGELAGKERLPMDETTIREMINRFYATTVDDVAGSSEIYADDAVLEFPQGKERIRGRANIIAFRSAYPAHVDIEPHRTVGRQDLWVNEFTIRYNGANPYNAVSIMEFRGGKVVRERIYYGEPWEPPAWRAQWVEPMEEAA
jgi:SnoaL-like domain